MNLTIAYYAKEITQPPEHSESSITSLSYVSVDHLAAPILISDETGLTSWQGGLEPFGASFHATQDLDLFLRLPGHWRDETWSNSDASDLFYNLFRWYDARLGRYLRADPLGAFDGTATYTYARSNPLSYSDPFGLIPFPGGKAVWCDELPPLFLICDCDAAEVDKALAWARKAKEDYCTGKGISNQGGSRSGAEHATVGSVHNDRAWIIPEGDPCVDNCACLHEEIHLYAYTDPRVDELAHLMALGEIFTEEQILDRLECFAWTDELACLKGY